MRFTPILLSSILASLLFLLSQTTRADDKPLSLPESQNQVIKITDRGLEPRSLEMKKEDRIAFFLNDSTDSLVTLELDFGSHASHCATENLKINENGMVRSIKPIAPKDFATTCFHDSGSYSFTVFGVKGSPQGLRGSIIVK